MGLLSRNRCLICACPGHILCPEHQKLYVLDEDNGWVRKKLRLERSVRKRTNKFHNTENKLLEILKLIFGRENVISSVHPFWALSDKNVLLEFDIGIVSKKLLVEFDGLQHYEFPNFFHKTRKDFEKQKERDVRKTELAKTNGWHLLRIKYNEDVSYGSIFKRLQREGYNG